ncbi:MAG TPA: hypothetical protein DCQ64_01430 [Candidatus Rokubacteria bacterium]|nr:hypothetical protein [Candidatus Rokubacteria bacterium]
MDSAGWRGGRTAPFGRPGVPRPTGGGGGGAPTGPGFPDGSGGGNGAGAPGGGGGSGGSKPSLRSVWAATVEPFGWPGTSWTRL